MIRLVGVLIAVLGGLGPAGVSGQTVAQLVQARNKMVDEEIVAAGVKNPRVIQSLRNTPRHEFVTREWRQYAYFDMALPIGHRQTISPPFVVAYMTEQVEPQPSDRVLEIGTGSGYQAAILSPLVDSVYTIEIVEPLGEKAERTLKRLGYSNVHVKVGDGFQGWPEHAPFDKIIVTCSPENVPQALAEQLREGGLMIIPVGERYQQVLHRLIKKNGKLESQPLLPTLFVPMTGAAESQRRVQPDPAHPALANGGFEELLEPSGDLAVWYYIRLMELVADPQGVREGKRLARFSNDIPGRESRALQGFPVDGRQVAALQVSLMIRGKGLRSGQNAKQGAGLVITFYDQSRASLGDVSVGPWLGTFDWRRESARIPVPKNAREAIFRISLLGGVGELDVDDVSLRAVP